MNSCPSELPGSRHLFFLSHLVVLQDDLKKNKKQTPRIFEYKTRCSNWMSLSACGWFKVAAWCLNLISPWKASVGRKKEIDCDISANHQGTLRRLMEILFSVEEARVKRLVPQREQRMWEWHSTTSLLSVSQTVKRHRRRLLIVLIFHLLSISPEVWAMNKNVKWKLHLMNGILTPWTHSRCFYWVI